jgi:hypothetical protein
MKAVRHEARMVPLSLVWVGVYINRYNPWGELIMIITIRQRFNMKIMRYYITYIIEFYSRFNIIMI